MKQSAIHARVPTIPKLFSTKNPPKEEVVNLYFSWPIMPGDIKEGEILRFRVPMHLRLEPVEDEEQLSSSLDLVDLDGFEMRPCDKSTGEASTTMHNSRLP
ncbi:unnamed protein product [Urochloa humidicola]